MATETSAQSRSAVATARGSHELHPTPFGSRHRFGTWLVLVILVALVVRLWFALGVASDLPSGVDSVYYHLTAESLVAGDGYQIRPAYSLWPTTSDPTVLEPAGKHPPLHPTLLAGGRLLGFNTWDDQRVFLSVVSVLGVALVGLIGRRVGGSTVGIVAAAIVALHPLWFQHPGFLSSEITYTVVVPALVLAGLVAIDRPGPRSMAVLGVAIGVAALTRSEAASFLVFLGAPVAWFATGQRLRSLLTVGVGCLLVVAPWVAWVHSTYGVWTLSLNGGVTLVLANNSQSYFGARVGAVDGGFGKIAYVDFAVDPEISGPERVAAIDAEGRRFAVDYAREHKGRLPVVMSARVGRTLGVYPVERMTEFDRGIGSHPPTQRVGIWLNWVLMVMAVGGASILWRRRELGYLVVLASGFAVALTTGILIYGATRMRISAEPAIAVLAALLAVSLVRRLRAAPRQLAPGPTIERQPSAPGGS